MRLGGAYAVPGCTGAYAQRAAHRAARNTSTARERSVYWIGVEPAGAVVSVMARAMACVAW